MFSNTLRLGEDIYSLFRAYAERDNRSLSNFIETSTLRYIQEHEYADALEMAEIASDEELLKGLRRGYPNAKARRGRKVQ